MSLLSDELMGCCAASTNGCLDLRCRAFALAGRVRAEWSRCPGSMARRANDSVAPLRRSSSGWMPARMKRVVRWCRTQAPSQNWQGVVDDKINEAGLRATAPGRSAVASSAVEWTRARVAIRNVVAPAPQPEPASRLRSATRDVSFLRSDSKCRRYVSVLFNFIPRYLGLRQKGRISLL